MRILLADDHKIIRDGLRSCLAAEARYEVVGEAQDGRQAVELADKLKPDLIIMDVGMPSLNGLEATRRITAGEGRRPRVVILSMHSDREFVAEAFKAGAAGYLLKASAFDEVLQAIKTVSAGGSYVSPTVATALVETLARPQDARSTVFEVLTDREREVLQLLAEGHSVKEIAFRLGIAGKTVHTFRARLMRKLNLHSLAELTKYAIRAGLTTLDH